MFLTLLTVKTYAQQSTNVGYCVDNNINESTPTISFDKNLISPFRLPLSFLLHA